MSYSAALAAFGADTFQPFPVTAREPLCARLGWPVGPDGQCRGTVQNDRDFCLLDGGAWDGGACSYDFAPPLPPHVWSLVDASSSSSGDGEQVVASGSKAAGLIALVAVLGAAAAVLYYTNK